MRDYSGFPIDVRLGTVAEPGPKLFDVRGWGYFTGQGHGALGLPQLEAEARMNANAVFVAHAPEDIKDLLEENDRLRAANRELTEAMESSLRGEK